MRVKADLVNILDIGERCSEVCWARETLTFAYPLRVYGSCYNALNLQGRTASLQDFSPPYKKL
ncbi:hypothetical protein PCC6912_02520 [Chlorogloeopsis fritschii PCC 6912]|uniref:Uncharacterized protein n=1 Tax=Chlorogloeopsis fritschii PCC 6912 TaxID=211165 RepID=A0A3S0Y2I7_CHLFR|nr:hypothetical protein PCC6912_02520 [Chlorogloeopsis fritschii PCC 6912]